MRFVFRSLRLVVFAVVLCVATLAWFVHKVGLPEFVKQRIIAQLRAAGWELEFSRMRLQGWHTVVAEDLQLRRTNLVGSPHLFIQEARMKLIYSSLSNFSARVDSIVFEGGRLLVPSSTTNAHSRLLVINDLAAEVILGPNDLWDLRWLKSSCFGVKMSMSGALKNGPLSRDWKLPGPARKGRGAQPADLSKLFEVMKQIKFGGESELAVRFQGDGGDFNSLIVNAEFSVPKWHSSWLSSSNLLVSARLQPSVDTNNVFTGKFLLTADSCTTPWIQAQTTRLNVDLTPTFTGGVASNAHVEFAVIEPKTPLGRAVFLNGTVDLCTNALEPKSLRSEVSLMAAQPETRWGQAQHADVHASLTLPPPKEWKFAQTNLDWTRRLENIPGEVALLLTNVDSPRLRAERLSINTQWDWPSLQMQTTGKLYGGEATLQNAFNVTNRDLSFNITSDTDLAHWVPMLSTNIQRAIARHSGSTAPKLQAQGRLVLPVWTNPTPTWEQEVLPSLSLAGHFELPAGFYRSNAFTKVESTFALTNLLWQMPQLKLTRSEGTLEAEFTTHLKTTEYHWRLTSEIDPQVAKPFFAKSDQEIFDDLQFTVPPRVEAELTGAWNDPDRILFTAKATGTNLTFRGETVQTFASRLQYTNLVLTFFEPELTRSEGLGRASRVEIDFASQLLYMTNAESHLDPGAITRVIGPHVVKAVQPYQFETAPDGIVNGSVDLKRHSSRNDLHFQIKGGPFRWQKFRFQKVGGQIDWVGDTLALRNVQGEFRTGRVNGEARFDFTPKVGTDFSFKANLVDTDLHEFLGFWDPSTNRIEGRLNAELNITSGNTDLPQSWQGFGWVTVHDGLLWEIPMFGVFSPVLNTFVPGLGNSRARKATSTYLITNSVISTTDLEVHATAMRMQFQGTVNFDSQVEARVEAELLRNLPAVGLVVSKVFWPVTKLFEYKVTGQLNRPKTEPVYVLPKILMAPFHPIKSLKELMGEGPNAEK